MTPSVIIIISVSSLILSAVGLLVNKIWRDAEANSQANRKSTEDLNKEIARLAASISGLNATVLAQADAQADFKMSCGEHKSLVNLRLNAHSETLKKHGEDIVRIKAKNTVKTL